MKKSLVPLIVFLFCIVLLTAIIVSRRPEMRKPASPDSDSKKKQAIYLSNIEIVKEPELRKRQKHIIDEKKILNLLLQAYSELDKGNVKAAEDNVKTVLVFQNGNNEALSLLGKIYYLKQEYKNAEHIFTKQIDLNGKSASACNNLGQALLKQKNYARAVPQFQMAQKLDPESGLIALNLAGAYAQQGKKQEAIAEFEKTFELTGTWIIPVANHPALDNIRDEKEFREIMKKAYKKLADQAKKEDK
jgi:Flp pilus assembly protein TadD